MKRLSMVRHGARAETPRPRFDTAPIAPIEPRGKTLLTRSGGDWRIGRAVLDDRERERWDSRRSSVDDNPTVIV